MFKGAVCCIFSLKEPTKFYSYQKVKKITLLASYQKHLWIVLQSLKKLWLTQQPFTSNIINKIMLYTMLKLHIPVDREHLKIHQSIFQGKILHLISCFWQQSMLTFQHFLPNTSNWCERLLILKSVSFLVFSPDEVVLNTFCMNITEKYESQWP